MHHSNTILVTGANGQLGSEFRKIAGLFPQFQFVFTSRNDLPIEDNSAVEKFFRQKSIGYCINCAAYTAVDKAEDNRQEAMLINAIGTGNLARVTSVHNANFIHFSTDYVFNGNASVPYKESDATSPVNYYGLTKLEGEQAAFDNNPASCVVRTSWVYSTFGNNFVKTMLRLMKERERISVVNDQSGSPTYAADLASHIMNIIAANNIQPGIYHYCNEGIITWYEFALAIKELSGSACIVEPIPTTAYPTPAKRPHYSALDTSRIQSVYGITIPSWKASLERCISKL